MVLNPSNSRSLEQLALKGLKLLIVSAIKICKQCLKNASGSVPLAGLRRWTPLVPRVPGLQLGCSPPPMKIPVAATAATLFVIYTVSQKVPTFKLSVTLSNLNRFSKFLHC